MCLTLCISHSPEILWNMRKFLDISLILDYKWLDVKILFQYTFKLSNFHKCIQFWPPNQKGKTLINTFIKIIYNVFQYKILSKNRSKKKKGCIKEYRYGMFGLFLKHIYSLSNKILLTFQIISGITITKIRMNFS